MILLFVFKYNIILLINDARISVNNIVCEKRRGTHGDHKKHPMNQSHVQTSQQHLHIIVCLFVCLLVFNTTFNNISVISWRLVLLVE